jgi:hypothetical protein
MALELNLPGQAPGTYNPQAVPNLTDEVARSNASLLQSLQLQNRGVLNNLEVQSKFEQLNQENNLARLKEFSSTIFDSINKYQERRDKEIDAEYYAKGLSGEGVDEARKQYEARNAQDQVVSNVTGQLSKEAQLNGASPASVGMLQNYLNSLSYKQRSAYLRGFLVKKTRDYIGGLAEKRAEFSKLNPEEQKAALVEYKKRFLLDNGILASNGVDPVDYVKNFDDKVRPYEDQYLLNSNDTWTSVNAQSTIERAEITFGEDKNANNYLSTLSSTQDPNNPGQFVPTPQIWKNFQNALINNTTTMDEVNTIFLNTDDPVTNKKMAIKDGNGKIVVLSRKEIYNNVRDYQAQKAREKLIISDEERNRQGQKAAEEYVKFFLDKRDYTNADLDDAKRLLIENYGLGSARALDPLYETSKDAKLEEKQIAQIENLKSMGALTPTFVATLTGKARIAGQRALEEQTVSGISDKAIKPNLDGIRDMVINRAVEASPNGKTVGGTVVGELQSLFRSRYAELVGTGTPASAAAQQASTSVQNEYLQAQKDPRSKYYFDLKKGSFTNYGTSVQSEARVLNQWKRDINSKIRNYGGTDSGWQRVSQEQNLMSRSEALAGISNARVDYLAGLRPDPDGLNKVRVINAQRVKYGLKPIDINTLKTKLPPTPRVRKALEEIIKRYPPQQPDQPVINEPQSSSSAPLGAQSGDYSSRTGSITGRVAITSAQDPGEGGTDFAIPDRNGAYRENVPFYFPYRAQVLEIRRDPRRIERTPTSPRSSGNNFIIRTTLPNGRTTDLLVAHFNDLNIDLKPGMWLAPGTYLGTQGRTGSTTGPHVSIDAYLPGTRTIDREANLWLLQNTWSRLARGQQPVGVNAAPKKKPSGGGDFGVATYYNRESAPNDRTANGDIFDDTALTAAVKPSLRAKYMGRRVKVTNPDTGKSIVVKVNDVMAASNPGERLLDLTEGAFKQLFGSTGAGVSPIQIKLLPK